MTNVQTGLPSRGGHGRPNGDSLIHQLTIKLSNDQVIKLPTERVQFWGAAGPNRIVLPGVSIWKNLMTQIYTNVAAGGYAVFSDADDNHEIGQYWLGGNVGKFLHGAAWVATGPTSDVDGPLVPEPIDDFINAALYLYVDNDGASDFTGGNVANYLRVACVFHVFDFDRFRFLTVDESGWDDDTRLFA